MNRNNKWGDDDDEELPEPTETPVDAKGLKTRTEYKMNGPARVRVTSKIRVVTETRRMPKSALARRQRMQKFGNALGVDHDNVTIVDEKNEVFLLDPAASEAEDQGHAASMNKALEAFQTKSALRALGRKYELDNLDGAGGDSSDSAPANRSGGKLFANATGGAGLKDLEARMGGGGAMENAFGGGGGGKYVPPGQRGGGGGGGGSLAALMDDKDRQPTLRVSNISEDTKEADLQELFEPFGSIYRIYLAKDKDPPHHSRGFAFVSYNRREDAELAMSRLQGFGYDHLILKLEWAKPSAKEGGGGGGGGGGGQEQYRSGYGKALAQDTTEKVSYASNLTNNNSDARGGKF